MRFSNKRLLGIAIAVFVNPIQAIPEQSGDVETTIPMVAGEGIDGSNSEGFIVTNGKLRDQDEWPYLFGGKVIDVNHSRWDEYADPLQKFPRVVDCLKDGSSGPNTTDLYRIDWSKLTSHRDVEVCLFRIFDTLGDPAIVRDWLEKMGYRTLPFVERANSGRQGLSRQPSIYFEAHIDRDVFRNRVSFPKRNRWYLFWVPKRNTPLNYKVNIGFTKDGEIYTVLSSLQGR